MADKTEHFELATLGSNKAESTRTPAPTSCADQQKECGCFNFFCPEKSCTCRSDKWLEPIYEKTAKIYERKCPKCLCRCLGEYSQYTWCHCCFCSKKESRYHVRCIKADGNPFVSPASLTQFAMDVNRGTKINAVPMAILVLLQFIFTVLLTVERLTYKILDEKDNVPGNLDDDDFFVDAKLIILGSFLFGLVRVVYFFAQVFYYHCNSACCNSACCNSACCNSTCCSSTSKSNCCVNCCIGAVWSILFAIGVVSTYFLPFFFGFVSLISSTFEFATQVIRSSYSNNSAIIINTYDNRETFFVRLDFGLSVGAFALTMISFTIIQLTLPCYFNKAKKTECCIFHRSYIWKYLYYIYGLIAMMLTYLLMLAVLILTYQHNYRRYIDDSIKRLNITMSPTVPLNLNLETIPVLRVHIASVSPQFWAMVAFCFLYPAVSLILMVMMRYPLLREASQSLTINSIKYMRSRDKSDLQQNSDLGPIETEISAKAYDPQAAKAYDSQEDLNCCKKFLYPFSAPLTTLVCFFHILIFGFFWVCFIHFHDFLEKNAPRLHWLVMIIAAILLYAIVHPYPFLVVAVWTILFPIILALVYVAIALAILSFPFLVFYFFIREQCKNKS